jgi:Domain of unknown function (DUF6916)
MSEFQTAADFEKCLDTNFRVELESPGPIEIKLIAVTPRKSEPHEQAGMERFSVVFSGPPDVFLPQNLYRMTHPEMGEFDVFLVPIAPEANEFRYEAVYNYYRPD